MIRLNSHLEACVTYGKYHRYCFCLSLALLSMNVNSCVECSIHFQFSWWLPGCQQSVNCVRYVIFYIFFFLTQNFSSCRVKNSSRLKILFLFTKLRVAEYFFLKIAIDGYFVAKTSFMRIINLSLISDKQTYSKFSTRDFTKPKNLWNWRSDEKKKMKNRNLISARTFQCDNKLKTELTGIVKEKKEIEEKIFK